MPEQTPQTQEGPQLTGALTCSPADQLSIKSLFTQAPLQSHHSRRWRGRGQQESTQSVFFRNNDPSRAERSSQSVIYVIYVICVICVIWWELEKKLFCTMMLKSETFRQSVQVELMKEEIWIQNAELYWQNHSSDHVSACWSNVKIKQTEKSNLTDKAAATAVLANKELGGSLGAFCHHREEEIPSLIISSGPAVIYSLLIN